MIKSQGWDWKAADWPLFDENTKLRQEEGPENNVPHFYADYQLVKVLFNKFEIIDIHQLEEFREDITRKGKIREFWHYHILARKPKNKQ